MAVRLGLDSPLVAAEQLLIYRVLLRDQPAIADLVQSVLGRLVEARGGAEPLLATLDAYFATGGVATETARRLHLSVRAVTYRLDRMRAVTGYDHTHPSTRHNNSPTTPRCSEHGCSAGRSAPSPSIAGPRAVAAARPGAPRRGTRTAPPLALDTGSAAP